MSDKVKLFLSRKLNEKEQKLRKIKRKQLIVRSLYASSIILSVLLSSCAAALTGIVGFPTLIITVFTTTSAVATTLSMKFNLKKKKENLQKMRDELSLIKNKLDYVISCNGSLSELEYRNILKAFT